MFQFSRFINPLLRVGKNKMYNSDQLITISKKYSNWMAITRQDLYLKSYSHSRLIQNPFSGFCSKQQPQNQNSDDVKLNQEQKQNIEITQQSNDGQNTKEELKEETPQEETNYTAIGISMLFPLFVIGNFIIYFVCTTLGEQEDNDAYGFLMVGAMFFLTLITLPPFFIYWGYRLIAYSLL